MKNTKKGEVWISAALYFGLGIIIITLILTAGMPVINKLTNRNTINWTFESKIPYSQPGIGIEEGNLNLATQISNIKGEYFINLGLDYDNLDVPTDISYTNPSQTITGFNKLIIKHNGILYGEVNVTITNL